jgi:transposase
VEIVHARCCGLDVHKKTVVACVLITGRDGGVERQLRTFNTMTADLLALDDWLSKFGRDACCTRVDRGVLAPGGAPRGAV